jgi:hypothetical protein
MSAPETHPVVGVAQMFCGKCGYAMYVERDGMAVDGHAKFKGTCAACRVIVDVPRMITDVVVVATIEQSPSGSWHGVPK